MLYLPLCPFSLYSLHEAIPGYLCYVSGSSGYYLYYETQGKGVLAELSVSPRLFEFMGIFLWSFHVE